MHTKGMVGDGKIGRNCYHMEDFFVGDKNILELEISVLVVKVLRTTELYTYSNW